MRKNGSHGPRFGGWVLQRLAERKMGGGGQLTQLTGTIILISTKGTCRKFSSLVAYHKMSCVPVHHTWLE